MAQHRYGFVIANEPSRDFKGGGLFGPAFNTIARFDFATATTVSFALDENSTAQEPVFVPRTPEAPEGDGYLLVLVNRFDSMLNDLLVLDTLKIADGPIGRDQTPHPASQRGARQLDSETPAGLRSRAPSQLTLLRRGDFRKRASNAEMNCGA